ncbi:MAG TPA: hypothetical protein VD768_08915, partial [Sphingomicrobium sp.]|nr:hypothetical protein [Sphingomicrobium sp.]
MTRIMLLAGAAALAVGSAATAAPQQGKGNNKGSAKVERSQKQARGGQAKQGKRGDIRVARLQNARGNDKPRFQQRREVASKSRGEVRKLARVDRDERKVDRVRIDRDERRIVKTDREDRRL